MLSLKYFLLKELKQILAHKKSLFICCLFIFYVPFLNYNAQNSLLPLSYIIPVLFIISGCYPSEYSYTIMNYEFEIQTYDIIHISKINPFVVIFSKLFFPVIFGMVICFSSISINNLISFFLKPEMYSLYLTFDLICFLVLSIVFSNVFILFFSSYFKKVINKQTYTLSIIINLAIILILYQFFYMGYHWGAVLILLLFCIVLMICSYKILKNYIVVKDDMTKKRFVLQNSKFILIQNSYLHTWNYKKTLTVLFITIIVSFYISFYITPRNIYIYQCIPIIINLYINTSIITNSYSFDKANRTNMFYLICKCNKHFIIFSKVIVAFLLSSISTIVFLMILSNSTLNSKIFTYLCVALFISLISLFSSMFIIKGRFDKQVQFIISILELVTSLAFLMYCDCFFILVLLNILVYAIIYYLFYKKRYNLL